ncbi:MAG: zinc-binding alcohol dehydrogenase [Spirochaeta sp.]|nr:zinc-binding alcohol dehydrogenase [Spirochaeta sp.]
MIRQLSIEAPGVLEWRSVEDPRGAPGVTLIETLYGAVKHGTEFAMIRGSAAARGGWNEALALHEGGEINCEAVPVGNMVVGTVIETDSADTFHRGDVVYGYGPLGEATAIATARTRPLREETLWRDAVCLDPARFALAALRDGQVRLGDVVAIFGLGAIGLICVAMARRAGAEQVIAVDPVAARRDHARALGATVTIDPAADDAGRVISESSGRGGADVVIDFSGNVGALQAALRGVAFGGTVVCGAFPAPHPAGLDLGAEAHLNRPQIVFSRAVSEPNRDYPRWDAARIEEYCAASIARGEIPGDEIVDRVVPFGELREALVTAMDDPAYATKLGVRVGGTA